MEYNEIDDDHIFSYFSYLQCINIQYKNIELWWQRPILLKNVSHWAQQILNKHLCDAQRGGKKVSELPKTVGRNIWLCHQWSCKGQHNMTDIILICVEKESFFQDNEKLRAWAEWLWWTQWTWLLDHLMISCLVHMTYSTELSNASLTYVIYSSSKFQVGWEKIAHVRGGGKKEKRFSWERVSQAPAET